MDYSRAATVKRVLSTGIWLGEWGTNSWALTRRQALVALDEFLIEKIPVVGGDVLKFEDGRAEYVYSNWICEQKPGELEPTFAVRSIEVARRFIRLCVTDDDGPLFFDLVPRS
jgi:hypothetical protein